MRERCWTVDCVGGPATILTADRPDPELVAAVREMVRAVRALDTRLDPGGECAARQRAAVARLLVRRAADRLRRARVARMHAAYRRKKR